MTESSVEQPPPKPDQADNVAARLHRLMAAAKGVPGHLSGVAGWSQVLGLESESLPAVLQLGATMHAMAETVHNTVLGYHDDNPELVLEEYQGVFNVLVQFRVLIGQQMNDSMSPYTSGTDHSLRLCAALMAKYDREPIIPQATVDELIKQTVGLMESVRVADDLDAGTKRWVLDHLREIQRKLDDIYIDGLEGVGAACDRLFGSMRRFPFRISDVLNSGQAAAFVTFVNTLAAAVNIAAGVHQLTSSGDHTTILQLIQPPQDGGNALVLPA